MNDDVTEALLEMYYLRAIADLFAQFYGVPFLRLLKPSARQEAWVGFDQGWVAYAPQSTQQLYAKLGETIKAGARQVEGFYVGYFMQFKVLREMVRRSCF